MDLFTGKVSNELFGGEVRADVKAVIEAAKQAPPDAKSSILWTAQALAPDALPVYYLLYKLHSNRRELVEAERAARLGLAHAGGQAGLPMDPSELLGCEPKPPAEVDFAENGAARFWLFTLKALAFISVRSGKVEDAEQFLAWVTACDPGHSVGSDVTAALVAAAGER